MSTLYHQIRLFMIAITECLRNDKIIVSKRKRLLSVMKKESNFHVCNVKKKGKRAQLVTEKTPVEI